MKKTLKFLLLATLLQGCAMVQIDENLEGLKGKYILLYVPETTDDAGTFCHQEMNLPLSAACVMISTTEEGAKAMFKGFTEAGDRIECIVVAPATNSLIMHELTRCATEGKNYWNTSKVRSSYTSTIKFGVQR